MNQLASPMTEWGKGKNAPPVGGVMPFPGDD